MIQLPATAAATREIVLKEESRELARTPVEKGRTQVQMPDRPGLYILTYDESSKVEKILSVNPSPKESELAYVDSPEAVKVWRVNTPAGPKKSLVSASQTALSLRGILQQQLWWWMIIGGLLALILEMAVAQGRREHE